VNPEDTLLLHNQLQEIRKNLPPPPKILEDQILDMTKRLSLLKGHLLKSAQDESYTIPIGTDSEMKLVLDRVQEEKIDYSNPSLDLLPLIENRPLAKAIADYQERSEKESNIRETYKKLLKSFSNNLIFTTQKSKRTSVSQTSRGISVVDEFVTISSTVSFQNILTHIDAGYIRIPNDKEKDLLGYDYSRESNQPSLILEKELSTTRGPGFTMLDLANVEITLPDHETESLLLTILEVAGIKRAYMGFLKLKNPNTRQPTGIIRIWLQTFPRVDPSPPKEGTPASEGEPERNTDYYRTKINAAHISARKNNSFLSVVANFPT